MTAACGLGDSHPLAASFYADGARHVQATIVENVQVARDTYRIRLECPELARCIVPGQFVMLRLPGRDDPLLGRPLALYDTWLDASGAAVGVDIVYLIVGRMTGRLAEAPPGERIEAWGPLGNGFSPRAVDRLLMVAGGIGQTPFLAVGREALGGCRYGDPVRHGGWASSVTLCYGVRTAEYVAGIRDFEAAGVDVRISSDDGSAGRHGLVTELLVETLDEVSLPSVRIACCGPERMMEAVAQLASARRIACEVSLETPMACGIGICFSCVVRVRQPDGSWDYKRTCVDGPVFDAEKIVW